MRRRPTMPDTNDKRCDDAYRYIGIAPDRFLPLINKIIIIMMTLLEYCDHTQNEFLRFETIDKSLCVVAKRVSRNHLCVLSNLILL